MEVYIYVCSSGCSWEWEAVLLVLLLLVLAGCCWLAGPCRWLGLGGLGL